MRKCNFLTDISKIFLYVVDVTLANMSKQETFQKLNI